MRDSVLDSRSAHARVRSRWRRRKRCRRALERLLIEHSFRTGKISRSSPPTTPLRHVCCIINASTFELPASNFDSRNGIHKLGAGTNSTLPPASFFQRNSVPSTHIRCMITASLRDTATIAFFKPPRLAIRSPHARNALCFWQRRSNEPAASKSAWRTSRSPHRDIRPS